MTKITRTFSRQELADLDLPDDHLYAEITHTSRWSIHYRGVFEHDGAHWQIEWQVPATESTECDTWSERRRIHATQVELRPVTVHQWLPVEAPAADGEAQA